MTSPTLGELRRRVDALEERRQAGPLSAAQRQELDALEADYAAKFPMPIDEMSDTKLEEFLEHHRSDAAGRYCELRDRCRTPEEIRRSTERLAAIDAMTAEEIDAYLAGLAKLPPSEKGR